MEEGRRRSWEEIGGGGGRRWKEVAAALPMSPTSRD